VLVDVPADRTQHWWSAAARAGAVLIGAGDTQRSVTAAYGTLKAVARRMGRQRYLWWAGRAVSEAAAAASYEKVAQTARRFLQVQLDYAGAVPADPVVARAERQRRPLVEAFPASAAHAACCALAAQLDALPRAGDPALILWQSLLGFEPGVDTAVHAPGPERAPEPLAAATGTAPPRAPARTALVSR
jgi:flagellar biosynthesis protein FlhG